MARPNHHLPTDDKSAATRARDPVPRPLRDDFRVRQMVGIGIAAIIAAATWARLDPNHAVAAAASVSAEGRDGVLATDFTGQMVGGEPVGFPLDRHGMIDRRSARPARPVFGGPSPPSAYRDTSPTETGTEHVASTGRSSEVVRAEGPRVATLRSLSMTALTRRSGPVASARSRGLERRRIRPVGELGALASSGASGWR